MIVFGICSSINAASLSKYNTNERYEQTLNTIKSIRDHVKDSYIILCENSPINNQQKLELSNVVDKFISVYDGEIYDNNIEFIPYNHKNKSAGELYQILNIISYIENLKYDLFFKISGRYFLLDDFNIETFLNGKINFREFKYDKYSCYSTVMYSFYKKHENLLKNYLYTIKDSLINGSKNIETAIYGLNNNIEVNNIPYLGVGGNIAPAAQWLKH
jgi:hypothetical protein